MRFSILALAFAAVFAAAAPLSAETVAAGQLETVRKSTSGAVTIVREADGVYVEFSEDFRTGSGPDLLVLLHKDADPKNYAEERFVSLGLMKTFRGAQRFKLPEGVDPAQFESVVLWCRQFDVTFGVAEI